MTTTYSNGTRIDHYEIIRQLGHGGMNNVYLALDTLNEEKVVLKFPNDDLISNVGVFERYKREAEIGGRLDHPHVQRVLNNDEERCEHYLVMEYSPGQGHTRSLQTRRAANGHHQTPDHHRPAHHWRDSRGYCSYWGIGASVA